jgi:hypothetical protein
LKNEEKAEADIPSNIIGGVEIINAKAIPIKKREVDKFGIPITENRLNWDKI